MITDFQFWVICPFKRNVHYESVRLGDFVFLSTLYYGRHIKSLRGCLVSNVEALIRPLSPPYAD